MRGGKRGICTSDVSSDPCAIPIRHRQISAHAQTSAAAVWSKGDNFLDWQGEERGQAHFKGVAPAGTPMVWTTSKLTPGSPRVSEDGFGYTPLNKFGSNFWLLDVDMDCSNTDNGWFQFKTYVTSETTGGWEADIDQTDSCGGRVGGTYPYPSNNHMARCGMLNIFYYYSGGCIIDNIPTGNSGGSSSDDGSCGLKSSISSRVVGGQPAAPNNWPWMLEILYQGHHGCGAVLISPTWAVTAGHCVRTAKTYGPWTTIVRTGELDRRSLSGQERDYFVKSIYKHPNFDKNLPGSVPNDFDIALLELLYPIDTQNDVTSACLPDGLPVDEFDDKECWLTGWGSTEGTGDNMHLQELQVDVKTVAECQASYGRNVSSRQVCAGGGSKQACSGDSGGPLSCKLHGRWYVVGLVSHGDDQCKGRPTIFTRISAFLDWIKSTTGSDLTQFHPNIVG